ncbi:c-type cytochrome [Acidicapsa dinghuensis]|uniref:Photosynthetic reaction center cytochrome c subunit n=1 Tax=Acidicapsa dinghuensis TaxID=2218256 RepID=A0ABW1EEQ2_9BACT|nr:c-type cytochrome [Acidicapsa dinghuensis]
MIRSRFRQATLAVSACVLTLVSLTLIPSHFAVQAAQESPQQGPPPGGPPPGGMPRQMPKPTNLKVLPKDLTGKEVHDIMDKWAGQLGVHCNTCHAADPNRVGPNGRPMLNFPDDSKQEKKTARVMYKMVQDINSNYVMNLPNAKDPVTCGTCHRGHQKPEAFVPPPEENHPH